MELIHSFFSKRAEKRAELVFRFSFDKDDWVILNQFPDQAFHTAIAIGAVYLDTDESVGFELLKQSPFNGELIPDQVWLRFNWGKDTVKEVIYDNEIDHWESKKDYKISVRNVDQGMQALCNSFVDDIVKSVGNRMTALTSEPLKDDPSCFEERVEIKY